MVPQITTQVVVPIDNDRTFLVTHHISGFDVERDVYGREKFLFRRWINTRGTLAQVSKKNGREVAFSPV
jgi:hypothetical protein